MRSDADLRMEIRTKMAKATASVKKHHMETKNPKTVKEMKNFN